jgi:hypothetical protein
VEGARKASLLRESLATDPPNGGHLIVESVAQSSRALWFTMARFVKILVKLLDVFLDLGFFRWFFSIVRQSFCHGLAIQTV